MSKVFLFRISLEELLQGIPKAPCPFYMWQSDLSVGHIIWIQSHLFVSGPEAVTEDVTCEHGHFWTEQMAERELTSQQYRQSKSLNSSRTLRRRGVLPSKTTLESASHHSSLWSSCSSDCEGTGLVTALWISFTGVMKHQLLLCYCSEWELCCWGDHGLTLLLGDCKTPVLQTSSQGF